MASEILMPALSPTMEHGTLSQWHVKAGDHVEAGDLLAEIETDKATMEVEAVDDGIIKEILIQEGTEQVPVNSPIAVLISDNEAAEPVREKTPEPVKEKTIKKEIKTEKFDKAPKIEQESPVPSQKESQPVSSEKIVPPKKLETALKNDGSDKIKISPLAKRLAKQHSIDLETITGSGPGGRIIKKDIIALAAGHTAGRTVEAAKNPTSPESLAGASMVSGAVAGATAGQLLNQAKQGNVTAKEPSNVQQSNQLIAPISDKEVFATYNEDDYELIPHTQMRKTVARRLTSAKSTIPHFYMTIQCQLDDLLQARKRMNEGMKPSAKQDMKLSVNDFIIKAMALSLQSVPEANSSWSEKGVLRHRRADIAVAVAVENGLYTPVVRSADLMTLSEISYEIRNLAQKAREGKLKPTDYLGGTTTISNLGMYGVDQFDAVINPPQATILAVGQGTQQPIVKDGELDIATIMTVTLSGDHRVMDGAVGAKLLSVFKGYIEDPVKMLV